MCSTCVCRAFLAGKLPQINLGFFINNIINSACYICTFLKKKKVLWDVIVLLLVIS